MCWVKSTYELRIPEIFAFLDLGSAADSTLLPSVAVVLPAVFRFLAPILSLLDVTTWILWQIWSIQFKPEAVSGRGFHRGKRYGGDTYLVPSPGREKENAGKQDLMVEELDVRREVKNNDE